MITFGRKLNHLRQKNHLTQKELGIALGFPEDSTDIRITQYEATTRKPLDEILVKLDKILGVLRALKNFHFFLSGSFSFLLFSNHYLGKS